MIWNWPTINIQFGPTLEQTKTSMRRRLALIKEKEKYHLECAAECASKAFDIETQLDPFTPEPMRYEDLGCNGPRRADGND